MVTCFIAESTALDDIFLEQTRKIDDAIAFNYLFIFFKLKFYLIQKK